MLSTIAWLPKICAPCVTQIGGPDGFGIERNLVRATADAIAHVLDVSDAAAPRERHETGLGNGFENCQRIAESTHFVIVAAQVVDVVAGDVEIDQFIDGPLVEALDLVDGIADDLMDLEKLAADQQPVLQQEHRDQPFFQHSSSDQLRSTARPALWLFSG